MSAGSAELLATRECRICKCNGGDDLISPCYCKGDDMAIHRSCLNEWRATRMGRAFTHCEICHFEYHIQALPQEDESVARCRKYRIRLFVARDTAAVFLLLQVLIVMFGLIVRFIDGDGSLRDSLPTVLSESNEKAYYVIGAAVFSFFLGIFGLFAYCIGCLDSEEQHQDQARNSGCCDTYTYSYIWCPGHYNHSPRSGEGCSGCGCSDCGDHNSSCDDCGQFAFVLLLIVVVVFVFIGIFVGIFLATLLFQRIIQRHSKIMWLRAEAKKFIVVDYYGKTVPPVPAINHHGIPELEIGLQPVPSAPPAYPSDLEGIQVVTDNHPTFNQMQPYPAKFLKNWESI